MSIEVHGTTEPEADEGLKAARGRDQVETNAARR